MPLAPALHVKVQVPLQLLLSCCLVCFNIIVLYPISIKRFQRWVPCQWTTSQLVCFWWMGLKKELPRPRFRVQRPVRICYDILRACPFKPEYVARPIAVAPLFDFTNDHNKIRGRIEAASQSHLTLLWAATRGRSKVKCIDAWPSRCPGIKWICMWPCYRKWAPTQIPEIEVTRNFKGPDQSAWSLSRRTRASSDSDL
jgi:hypothetical protein